MSPKKRSTRVQRGSRPFLFEEGDLLPQNEGLQGGIEAPAEGWLSGMWESNGAINRCNIPWHIQGATAAGDRKLLI